MTHTDLIARLREHAVRGDSPIANEAADALTAAQERIEALEGALRGMLEPFGDDPCRLDHHGYCQEHFIQPAEWCCVAVARAALDATDNT